MKAEWQATRRVLAVRLDSMGDMLMTEPALRAVRAGGKRHVTLLTSAAGAEVAELMGSVDEIVTYSAPWMKSSQPAKPAVEQELIGLLRDRHLDGALIFTVNSQNPLPAAFLCYLAAIPLRGARCRENPYRLLTHWLHEDEPPAERHEVQRQLSLVQAFGFMAETDRISIGIDAFAWATAKSLLVAAGWREDRPWLALHPGASAPSRRYPLEGFAEAAHRLVVEDGWQVVLLGGPDDVEQVRDLKRKGTPGMLCLENLSVGQLAATIDRAQVFIGNNSGPMHLAAAVGTPAVVTYAQTNPQHTPWGVPAIVLTKDVPCRNCRQSVCPLGHHACLRGINSDEIVRAVRQLVPITAARLASRVPLR